MKQKNLKPNGSNSCSSVRVKKNGTKRKNPRKRRIMVKWTVHTVCKQTKKKGNETINDVSISDSNNLSPRIQEKKTTT